MNTEKFESYFKTPALAQQLLDRLCEQLEDITADTNSKVDEVKPKNLGGWSAFSTKRKHAKTKRQAWWLYIKAMEKLVLRQSKTT